MHARAANLLHFVPSVAILQASAVHAAEAALDAVLEFVRDDDGSRIVRDIPCARRPREAAASLLERLDELAEIPPTAKERLEATRGRLEEMLRTTSLDDIDGANAFAWLMEAAKLVPVDDTRPLDAALEAELRGSTARWRSTLTTPCAPSLHAARCCDPRRPRHFTDSGR